MNDVEETLKNNLLLIEKNVKKETTGIVWFGNDLRIHDNEVLAKAVLSHHRVIAFYCIDPTLFHDNQFGFKKMDIFRAQFLLETLKDLQQQLIKKKKSPKKHVHLTACIGIF